MISWFLLAAALSAGASGLLSPLILRALQRADLLDHSTARSSHSGSVPRGGGSAVILAASAATTAVAVASDGLSVVLPGLAAMIGFSLLGLSDDWRPLGARTRLAAQSALGLGFVLWVSPTLTQLPPVLVFSISTLFIVGFVNVFNFMDGINGISCGTAALIGAALAVSGSIWGDSYLPLLPLTLACAAVGFAPFNFPTARVFLGDVGSYGIGAGLATSAVLLINDGVPLLAVLLPFSLYIGDTAWTLIRRIVARKPILESHRDHVYQQLANGSWGHTKTALTVVAFIFVHAILGIAAVDGGVLGTSAAVMFAGATVVFYLALPMRVSVSNPDSRTSHETV